MSTSEDDQKHSAVHAIRNMFAPRCLLMPAHACFFWPCLSCADAVNRRLAQGLRSRHRQDLRRPAARVSSFLVCADARSVADPVVVSLSCSLLAHPKWRSQVTAVVSGAITQIPNLLPESLEVHSRYHCVSFRIFSVCVVLIGRWPSGCVPGLRRALFHRWRSHRRGRKYVCYLFHSTSVFRSLTLFPARCVCRHGHTAAAGVCEREHQAQSHHAR
jgi:hypothetical protein